MLSRSKLRAASQAGTVIELFVGDDDIVDYIVSYFYEIAEITGVSSKVPAAAAKKGATTSIKVKYEGASSSATKYDAYENNAAAVLAGYDADTYVKDTKIVVVKTDANKIIYSAVAESVEGLVSAKGTDYATIDGTKYTMAGTRTIGAIDFDKEYTIYLDPNGYGLEFAGDDKTDLKNVYYVTGIYSDTTKGTTTNYAEVVSLDGEVKDVVIADPSDFTTSDQTNWKKVGGVYLLTLNKYDEYEAVEFDKNDNNDDYDVNVGTLAKDVKADAASATFGSKTYFDDTTKFVSIKIKDDSAAVKEVKTAEGGMSMKAGVTAIAITEDGKVDALNVLYVGAISAAVNTEDVVFVTKQSTDEAGDNTFWTDVVFMADNTADSIVVEVADDATTGEAVGFYTYAINDDNHYELTPVERKASATAIDEDYSGWNYVMFTKSGIHGSTVSYNGNAVMEDVAFAGATVSDLRDQDALSSYKYARAIVDTEDIVDAAEVVSAGVRAYVYVTDGVITYIAVTHEYN